MLSNIQPEHIEEYFIAKGKKETDKFGWTGQFSLSAKDILDFIIDLNRPSPSPSAASVDEAADKAIRPDYYIGDYNISPALKDAFKLGAEWRFPTI